MTCGSIPFLFTQRTFHTPLTKMLQSLKKKNLLQAFTNEKPHVISGGKMK